VYDGAKGAASDMYDSLVDTKNAMVNKAGDLYDGMKDKVSD